jgi:hypothetical protein
MTLSWRQSILWSLASLLVLLFALIVGPVPALAYGKKAPGVVLYEVTEDMYLLDANGTPGNPADPTFVPAFRTAVAQLSGFARLGTPICPWDVLALLPKAKHCTVNASGADQISLLDGRGTLKGTFAVVVQGDNLVDAPEFVIMTGQFGGDADLSPAFSGVAPLGSITNGAGQIDTLTGAPGPTFAFDGTFRLPFSIEKTGKHGKPRRWNPAYYLGDDLKPIRVKHDELSLGLPTVRIEINFK